MTKTYHGHGKLLITGEYAVLEGAQALALPTKKGQTLTVEQHEGEHALSWNSFDANGECWFSCIFNNQLKVQETNNVKIADTLKQVLEACRSLNPFFLTDEVTVNVTTHLEFNRKWGWGTSSTLIHNLAQWAAINPYQVLAKTFGGSGYDLACANAKQPILYKREENTPRIKPVSWKPEFLQDLLIVYLNEKQNSRNEISRFKGQQIDKKEFANKISSLTEIILQCNDQSEFETFISEHEAITGSAIGKTPIQKQHFHDYPGAIKSLGAWGGDFILATRGNSDYFKQKGYETIFRLKDIIPEE